MAGQYDRIVQPGESGKIPVKINLGTHGGRQTKIITVYTNAPGEGAMIKLGIAGDVWVALEVQPPSASFGRMTSDKAEDATQTQKLTITNNVEASAELTNVRSTNPAFKAETSVIEPGKKFELLVTMVPPLKPGNNAGTIEISTGVKDMPTLSVPVSAVVAPEVEVMPSSLSLPADISTALNRQLFVRNNSKTPVQLSGLEASNPDLKVALNETQPGMTYQLVVDVPAGYKPPPTGDKITIKTNNPTVPLLTVPVTQLKAPTTPPAAQPAAAGAPGQGQIRATLTPTAGGSKIQGTPVPGAAPAGAGTPAGRQPPAGAKAPGGAPAPAGTQPPSTPKPPNIAQPPAGAQAPAEAKPAAGAQPAAGENKPKS